MITQLNNGHQMPMRGFGTAGLHGWQDDSINVTRTVSYALNIGYRHFDTAPIYGNEKSIGCALKNTHHTRESLFVTSKVAIDNFGFDKTLRAFDQTIDNLGIDYVDLYLLHWPIQTKMKQTWQALEKLVGQGLVHSIGVSNFRQNDLDQLLDYANIKPACNQVELHPHLNQKPLRQYCQSHNITVVSWSPLGTAQWKDIKNRDRPFNDPLIIELSKQYRVSQGKLVLRWHYQNNLTTIAKSESPNRIKENFCIADFEISQQHMIAMDNLNRNTSFAPTVEGID